jgi:hypothetical protein
MSQLKVTESNVDHIEVGTKVSLTNNGSEIARLYNATEFYLLLEVFGYKVEFHMNEDCTSVELRGFARYILGGPFREVKIVME